jgi:hypothetical protein
MAEEITEEKWRRERVCLMDSVSKFNKPVLESEELDRISAQESYELEWFNLRFYIRGSKGFGHGTGGGRTRKNDKESICSGLTEWISKFGFFSVVSSLTIRSSFGYSRFFIQY